MSDSIRSKIQDLENEVIMIAKLCDMQKSKQTMFPVFVVLCCAVNIDYSIMQSIDYSIIMQSHYYTILYRDSSYVKYFYLLFISYGTRTVLLYSHTALQVLYLATKAVRV